MNLFDSYIAKDFIAHRGLHDEQNPENSIGAFEKAIEGGYPIELDVHLLADGKLAVFHDKKLARMTNTNGYITSLTSSTIKDYKLKNTEYTIPLFADVLKLIDCKVPVLIEIKSTGSVGELEKELLKELDGYKGEFSIISFNPYSLGYIKKHAPQIIRGQLGGFLEDEKILWIKKVIVKKMLLNNKVSCPDFIIYDAKNLPNRFVKKYKHLPIIAFNVKSKHDHMQAMPHCDNIIFENFIPKK